MNLASRVIGFVALSALFFIPQTSWSQVEGIDGTWYFGEKPVSIEVYDSGWRF